jgi:hypothetical protein
VDQFKKKTSQVGKAVYEILSQKRPEVTTGEVLTESAKRYVEEMEATINSGIGRYELPFYIVVLTKKEPWALNVMRNWFIARQTEPSSVTLEQDYPNHQQTVYRFHNRGEPPIDILWSLPTPQDCQTVLDNPCLYHPQLLNWIVEHKRQKII